MKTRLLFCCSMLLLSGCTSFYMPWAAPYENFKTNLGEINPVSSLPPHKFKEVWLGYNKQPDGIQVNLIGAGEQCVFAFEIDTATRRVIGWRYASKNNPQECAPTP